MNELSNNHAADDTAATSSVKVLFCSADHDAASFRQYFDKMPTDWSAVPYDEDGEDDRDDLLEALNANTLPTLLLLDAIKGTVLESNAVHAVQAGGSGANFEALLQQWWGRIVAGASASSSAPTVAVVEEMKQDDANTTAAAGGSTATEEKSNELHHFVPAPPALICQYFKEQLLSPDLPEALQKVILRREYLKDSGDEATKTLADSIMAATTTTNNNDDRWLFRTAAPALPMSWYGSSVLGLMVDASALECWTLDRGDNADNDNNGEITKATCVIENETGRSLLVFRETTNESVPEVCCNYSSTFNTIDSHNKDLQYNSRDNG